MSENLSADRLAIVDEQVASFFETLASSRLKLLFEPADVSDLQQESIVETCKERALDLMDACKEVAVTDSDVDQVDVATCVSIAEARIKHYQLGRARRPRITKFFECFNLVELYNEATARSATKQDSGGLT